MLRYYLYPLLLFCVFAGITGTTLYNKTIKNHQQEDVGVPLVLTDLINSGKIIEAQQAAQVELKEFLGVKSYSGYFRVDDTHDTNLFFWFFPSESNYETDPVLLWLQGGPGASDMIGLFQENGPFIITNQKIERRNASWTKTNSVLYIDQPAAVGFSYTNTGFARNQTKVSLDIYNALIQFFKLFPNLQKNDFFATGESYAGKYIPCLCYTIHKNNPSAVLKINLKGLAIGNGICVPKVQRRFAHILYVHGLIDSKTREIMEELENKTDKLIDNGDYIAAVNVLNEKFDMFKQVTGFNNFFNYLEEYENSTDRNNKNWFFSRADVKKALHVGKNSYIEINNDYKNIYLKEDLVKSVAPELTELLNNYKVLMYNGQLDLRLPYQTMTKFLEQLNFNGSQNYKAANRTIWYYNDGTRIAGYAKVGGNLTEVLVRNAGHLVPQDQPEWALDLISRFTRGKPFSKE